MEKRVAMGSWLECRRCSTSTISMKMFESRAGTVEVAKEHD